MIKLTSDIGSFYKPDITLSHIQSLLTAFCGSVLAPDVWVQTKDEAIVGVIARGGGRLYIYSEGGDPRELYDFINLIGYGEILCSSATAESLKLKVVSRYSVMLRRFEADRTEISKDICLSDLYHRLLLGADGDITLPCFEDFAPDVSHRLRHGGAAAVLSDNGAVLAFLNAFGGIINGISVSKEKRNRGEGSKLLSQICAAVGGDIFALCSGKTTEFYIKNGFEPWGEAVIAR